ncbi:GNAT family N-acetyltransferase [Nafulsella turpanensis]|uniref:GNAT family N-acetyltransferase n=1 Tax=Nafulsella turpanensis TaxID=1265690 RepID=UPI001F3C9009|nr:GNAT family N-acetyltransferase [Nafulsella turpanensis]
MIPKEILNEMIVRSVELEDIGQLSKLFDDYRVFYEKESDLDGAKRFLTERIEKNESVIYVADSGNALCGFVQLYPIFSSTRMNRLWLLNDLFVNKLHRGKGISKKLIGKAKELARETKSSGLILETAKNNIVGNQLYLRTDFSLDTDHNYYSWEE